MFFYANTAIMMVARQQTLWPGGVELKTTMKMHSKILLLCLGCTLAALMLQTLLFQRTSSALIYNQAKEESFHLLQNMQDEIYSFVKSVESGMIEIYNEKEFMRDLKKGTAPEELKSRYYRLAYNMALNHFGTSDGVVAFYVYNIDHQIISTYRRAVTPRHNYPQDIYDWAGDVNVEPVKNYVDSDDVTMLVTSYYNQSRETDIVRFVLKLYNNSNTSSKIGYVICDIDSKVLRSVMEKYSTNKNMYTWLQPMGDRPVAMVGEMDGEDLAAYSLLRDDIFRENPEKEEIRTDADRVFFQVKLNKYNLSAYSLMPQWLLRENQKTLNQNLVMIVLVMSFLAVLLSAVVSKNLTRPLEGMMKTVKAIQQGDLNLRMENLKRDELGQLGQSFNEMLDQIEGLIGREYEAKLMLNRAEYKALQAQINPHFLYNTLDTMSSIAQIQNCPQVSALSQSLSNIFRYSLDMKHPFSTVAKEIVHLKNYIYVMNVRMQEQVKYIFDLDDRVLKGVIPRLSIQPLVENALNHGLRNARGEKTVTIRGVDLGGQFQIIVADNGVGMSAEKVRELLNHPGRETAEGTTSIGLQNIHSRMNMLYGEKYGLTIESRPGQGTSVMLTIPYRKEEEDLWNQIDLKY